MFPANDPVTAWRHSGCVWANLATGWRRVPLQGSTVGAIMAASWWSGCEDRVAAG